VHGEMPVGVFPEDEGPLAPRLVVILRGPPCTWARCTFCPFALDQAIDMRRLIEDNTRIIAQAKETLAAKNYPRISIYNGGSIYELPLHTLTQLTPLTRNRIVDVETRPEMVTRESIHGLLRLLQPARLIVRIGFENIDEHIREHVLRKGIPQTEIQRITILARTLKAGGAPVEFCSYILFGMEGVPEDTVERSLRYFKENLGCAIAVRYQRILPRHPSEKPVSPRLRRILETTADLVDWGGEQWEFETAPTRSGTAQS